MTELHDTFCDDYMRLFQGLSNQFDHPIVNVGGIFRWKQIISNDQWLSQAESRNSDAIGYLRGRVSTKELVHKDMQLGMSLGGFIDSINNPLSTFEGGDGERTILDHLLDQYV